MRNYAWMVLSIGLTFSLIGCGDSANGSGGSGGSGSGGTGGSGGGGAMVAVSGTVSAAALEGNPTPVEGATVSVVGTSNTATTDASGNFSVMAPVGTVLILTTADASWGSLFAEDVPSGGLSGVDAEVIPDALVDALAGLLGTTADTSKGIVAVTFPEQTAIGGETASIDVSSELSFFFDALDDPVEGDTLVAGGSSELIFINVDVAGAVTATATSADAMACPPEFPGASYSVQAKVFTEIDVVCPVQ